MDDSTQKTLLITGATGFLGSYLVKRLIKHGHRVSVLIRENSNMQRLASVREQVRCFTLDPFRIDSDLARPFSELGNIDAIIHCATNYGRNNEGLHTLIESNTAIPLHLLQLAIEARVSTFINTDTILPSILNNYTFSKHLFKEWGRYLSQTSITRFINLRFEHFYGPTDDVSKFTSYIVQACLDNQSKLKLTAGEQQRDFIYIDDATSVFMTILNQLIHMPVGFSEYDVGSGQIVSIRQFVETVRRLTNSSCFLDFGALPYRANEMMFSNTNIEPLRSLGWRCQFSLEQGLSKMISLHQRSLQNSYELVES